MLSVLVLATPVQVSAGACLSRRADWPFLEAMNGERTMKLLINGLAALAAAVPATAVTQATTERLAEVTRIEGVVF